MSLSRETLNDYPLMKDTCVCVEIFDISKERYFSIEVFRVKIWIKKKKKKE